MNYLADKFSHRNVVGLSVQKGNTNASLPISSHHHNTCSVFRFSQVPEINGFLTAGRKKNGEVEDELDRSLEGMDHSDDQFDKGNSKRDADVIWTLA